MTKSNSIQIEDLVNKLTILVAEREAWETGAYATSNQQLYALLDKCLTVASEAKHSALQRAKITQMLDERGIAHNASTNTLTKIVRLVFGNCGKRAYSYARVLSVAAAEKPEHMSLATFITNNGGIEEIRRRSKSGVAPSVVRQQNIAFATRYMIDAEGLIQFAACSEIAPHPETENNLGLAVVRFNADGTSNVVFNIPNKSLLNTALELAGKQLGAAQQATDTHAKEVERKQTVCADIAAALAA